MTELRRLHLLLRAYEELTSLESFALRQENFEYLRVLREKKKKIIERIGPIRKQMKLSQDEEAEIKRRVDELQAQEQKNLDALAAAMASVKSSLQMLNKSSRKIRQIGQSYRSPLAASQKQAFAGQA